MLLYTMQSLKFINTIHTLQIHKILIFPRFFSINVIFNNSNYRDLGLFQNS